MEEKDFKFEYKTYSSAKTHLRYHIIFSTKYRKKCLDPIRQYIFDAFKYVESKSDFKIIKMNIDKDHIHFIVTFRPSLSIEQVVRRMKQMSTKYLYDNHFNYLKYYYWKNKVLWTGGYFCSTIGSASEQTVLKYIENQG